MFIGGLRPSLRWLRIYNIFGFILYSLRTKALRTFYLIKSTKLYNSIIKGLDVVGFIGL
jgi:hypothetical protein